MPIRASPRASSGSHSILTLVGLTARIVGGVGVANAVHAFVERKRGAIATLKSIGAAGLAVGPLPHAVMLIAVLARFSASRWGRACPSS